MKRILFVLMGLLSVFFIMWGIKVKTPINRPSNLVEAEESAWYENRYTAPKADDEWYLDPEIPLNYIPVPGEDELYMVVDDSGKITGYRRRIKQADGSWLWEDVNPDIPENYEKVEGLENVYKVTNSDGSISYVKYVRNDDDTFTFVPVDKNGVPLDDGKDAETIESNYIHVDKNVYAVYNDENVLMGYRERVKDDSGKYIWKVCDKPHIDDSVGNGLGSLAAGQGQQESGNGISSTNGTHKLVGSSGNTKTDNGDGTYTIKETSTSTETKEGYRYTYQTTIYSTYDSKGSLLSTRKEGPFEVNKVAVGGTSTEADKSQIASTLDGELSRVSGKVSFDTEKAKEVLALLNAERANQGLKAITMNSNSEAYKLACIRAADMAVRDHASSNSPMYGTLAEMASRFNVGSSHPSENIWRASSKTASQIHTKFQANENSRKVRMSNGYTQVGIAIVEMNGQTYIAEIYLN